MTTITRSLALASAGLLVLGLSACGDSKSSGGAQNGGTQTGGSSDGTFAVDDSRCAADATTALAEGEPIKIGTSQPLSGPLAVPGAANVSGFKAYFDKVNAAGGIDGHKLELVAKDDAFDPARAVTNAQSFVGQEKVFATLGQIGTPSIKATQPILDAACIPQLWVITTSSGFADPSEHGWTINGIVPAPLEAKAMVDYIASVNPGGTVGELKGTDPIGEDFHAALPPLAEDAGLTVLPAQTIPAGATNIDAQISALVAAEPDAVVLEALPNYTAGFLTGLARAGYDGTVVLNSSANAAGQWITPSDPAGEGAVVALFRKDPLDPRWTDDAAVNEYKADMTSAGEEKSIPFGNALDGYNFALMLTENLKAAAAMPGGLTRVNLMNAAWNMSVTRPLMLEPQQTTSGPTDPYAVEAGEMAAYSTKTKGWVSKQDWNFEGQAVEIISTSK